MPTESNRYTGTPALTTSPVHTVVRYSNGERAELVALANEIGLRADARQAALSGGLWTLASTSVVESISIPDFARGFRLRPSADVRFAIGEDPVALAGETLVVGNTAYANETETRLLVDGTGRTLRLLGTSAGMTVGVGFF